MPHKISFTGQDPFETGRTSSVPDREAAPEGGHKCAFQDTIWAPRTLKRRNHGALAMKTV